MKIAAAVAFAVAALASASSAFPQIYKCPGAGGRISYSQTACPGEGQLLDSHRPSSDPPPELTQRREVERALRLRTAPPPGSPTQAAAGSATRASCLDEKEVANLQTSSTSIRLDNLDREVYVEQIRRAKACKPLMSNAEMRAMKEELRRGGAAARPPAPSVITGCDRSGCWGSNGTRYESMGGNTFTVPGGGVCNRVGDHMQCH